MPEIKLGQVLQARKRLELRGFVPDRLELSVEDALDTSMGPFGVGLGTSILGLQLLIGQSAAVGGLPRRRIGKYECVNREWEPVI